MTETIQDTAKVVDGRITGTNHYNHPTPHSEDFELEIVGLDNPKALYWVAVNGDFFGVIVVKGETCIANVQGLVARAMMAAYDNVYVIWRPKTVTAAIVKRWGDKWSKRTASGAV